MKKTILLFAIVCLSTICLSSCKREDEPSKADNMEYVALVLDSASHEALAQYASARIPWADEYKLYCHHMTIMHYKEPNDTVLYWALNNDGHSYTITATKVGHSDKAFAVEVDRGDVRSANELAHITMATHPSADGVEYDSNFITEWEDLPQPMKLTGTVTFFYLN